MTTPSDTKAAPVRQELAALRRALSSAAQAPLILSAQPDLPRLDFVPETVPSTLSHPCGIVVGAAPAMGQGRPPCVYGRSAAEVAAVTQACRRAAESPQSTAADRFEREAKAQAATAAPTGIFAGEIALVTGAASGIGKACVESLLGRGAAVIGLDINPRITGLFPGPGYLGLVCDVADEESVDRALEDAVAAFGGLDMLVLNAGVFPPGCNINALKLAEWQRVMRINLDAGLIMLRECHPLLKAAPGSGRVVVNGSRNVPAPGPGAAAYSCSKAALTQLARVAALEWAKDNIRVNIFHAHAVFDTGIWTEEVLQSRASHYGMTVDQYKRNNLLKTEITSRDVGELAAEMCGPLFAKSTGAQVPIDGGSDRVV